MPTVFDDGAFTVDKGDWGYQSFTREGDKVVLSMSEWECVMWTRAWLKAQQDGSWPEEARVMNNGKVGGKL